MQSIYSQPIIKHFSITEMKKQSKTISINAEKA